MKEATIQDIMKAFGTPKEGIAQSNAELVQRLRKVIESDLNIVIPMTNQEIMDWSMKIDGELNKIVGAHLASDEALKEENSIGLVKMAIFSKILEAHQRLAEQTAQMIFSVMDGVKITMTTTNDNEEQEDDSQKDLH